MAIELAPLARLAEYLPFPRAAARACATDPPPGSGAAT